MNVFNMALDLAQYRRRTRQITACPFQWNFCVLRGLLLSRFWWNPVFWVITILCVHEQHIFNIFPEIQINNQTWSIRISHWRRPFTRKVISQRRVVTRVSTYITLESSKSGSAQERCVPPLESTLVTIFSMNKGSWNTENKCHIYYWYFCFWSCFVLCLFVFCCCFFSFIRCVDMKCYAVVFASDELEVYFAYT